MQTKIIYWAKVEYGKASIYKVEVEDHSHRKTYEIKNKEVVFGPGHSLYGNRIDKDHPNVFLTLLGAIDHAASELLRIRDDLDYQSRKCTSQVNQLGRMQLEHEQLKII